MGFNNRTSSIEIVDSQAETDTDNDGVNDAFDQCPNTPQSYFPNAQGCGLSQLDFDNDGINDSLDQCPKSPNSASVNELGCAASQRISAESIVISRPTIISSLYTGKVMVAGTVDIGSEAGDEIGVVVNDAIAVVDTSTRPATFSAMVELGDDPQSITVNATNRYDQ